MRESLEEKIIFLIEVSGLAKTPIAFYTNICVSEM